MENPTAPGVAPEAKYLGRFIGSELDHDHCELLAIQHVPHKLLRSEPELFGTKWFDYRGLHAVKATYLFAHLYNKAYGRTIGVMQDIERAPFAKAMKGNDFMESREKLSLWRLRQAVDVVGMRYDFFLTEAMNWHLENGWQHPPRPQHLLHNEEMIESVLLRWEQLCSASIQAPKSPAFQTENFIGSRDQLDFEDWMIQRIMRRSSPKYALRSVIYDRDLLRIEAALSALPLGLVNEVVEIAESVSHD